MDLFIEADVWKKSETANKRLLNINSEEQN